MKPIAALALLLLMTAPGLACPQQTAQAASEEASTMTDASSAAPTEANPGEQESAEEETGSNDDVMKKFTRHRPGACPEGPPCKVED